MIASLLFLAKLTAPFAACFFKAFVLTLVALYNWSSVMFEHLDKNKKKNPDATKKHPTMLLKPVVSSPLVTYNNKPTKILKIPLPPPVKIKKKFLEIHGILNDDPIIINPNRLYFIYFYF